MNNANSTPKTLYFLGAKVELTGKTETHHGGLFHVGTYLDGHRKGETVHVADRLVQS